MPEALALFLQYGLPVLLQLAADKNVINEEQKLLIQALAATEEFLGNVEIVEKFPNDKNGQFEEREPSATNINREDVTG
jgi:hypothetical protein